MLFKAMISVFQLLTIVVATTEQNTSPKKRLDDDEEKIKFILLADNMNRCPINEMTLKKYVDISFEPAINSNKREFPSSNTTDGKYESIDKFIATHFNGVALLRRMQTLGNRDPKKPIHYSVAIQVAYYSYILNRLMKCNALPVDKDNMRISFDKLYSYITDLISNLTAAGNDEKKEILGYVGASIDKAVNHIEKRFGDDMLELRTLSEEDKNVLGDIFTWDQFCVKTNLTKVLDNLYSENKIKYSMYADILNFYNIICTVHSLIKTYIKGIAEFCSHDSLKDELDFSNPNATHVAWLRIYFSEQFTFIKELICFTIGPEKIDSFVKTMEPAYNAATEEDYKLQMRSESSIPSDNNNSLFKMIFLNQPLKKENEFPNINIDMSRKEKPQGKPAGKSTSSDGYSIWDILVWIIIGLAVTLVIFVIIYISYSIYLKYS